MTTKNVKKANAFGGLADMMNGSGLGDIFDSAGKPTYSQIDAADIRILPQQRNSDEMETEEQTIAELADSIKANGLIAPIVLVANDDGSWRLICGERRVRACQLIELDPIPAMCWESLTEDQIRRIQFAENTQRLNLSQINEAQVLKNDIDEHGSIEAVMELRNKSRSWISKRLSLLDLPKETTRLLTENITADIEVINTVRQIEKVSPEAAAATVVELKQNLGKAGVNARDTATKAKDKVKPPKKERAKPVNPDNVAKPKDTSFKEAGAVVSIELDSASNQSEEEQQDFGFSDEQPLAPVEALNKLYSLIAGHGNEPKAVYESMPVKERQAVEEWLQAFYDAGIVCQNLANAVIHGFRSGKFSDEGYAAFALVAFLNGGEEGVKFNPLNIIGTVKR